jgi:uridine kinase
VIGPVAPIVDRIAAVRADTPFSDIDVIVVEGIYLPKRAYHDRYDLSVWIDCSFDAALARAIARAHEGVPPEDTVRAYRTIYFPCEVDRAAPPRVRP